MVGEGARHALNAGRALEGVGRPERSLELVLQLAGFQWPTPKMFRTGEDTIAGSRRPPVCIICSPTASLRQGQKELAPYSWEFVNKAELV